MTGQELVERAEAASAQAYAPYSEYLVGATLLLKDGTFVDGVNVESAAYPLGVCAERTAISKAASEGVRPGDIDAIGITASRSSNDESTVRCIRLVSGSSGRWKPGRSASTSW